MYEMVYPSTSGSEWVACADAMEERREKIRSENRIRCPFWPWCGWVNHFIHKKFLIQRSKYFFIPRLGYLFSVLYKHGLHFSWGFLSPSYLATLGTTDPLYHWSSLVIRLNCLNYKFGYVRVRMGSMRRCYGRKTREDPELKPHKMPILTLYKRHVPYRSRYGTCLL